MRRSMGSVCLRWVASVAFLLHWLAPASATAEPVVLLKFSMPSFNRWLETSRLVARELGQEQQIQMAGMQAKMTGVDLEKPLGGYVVTETNSFDTGLVMFLPMQSQESFFNFLKLTGAAVEDLGGGIYEATNALQPGKLVMRSTPTGLYLIIFEKPDVLNPSKVLETSAFLPAEQKSVLQLRSDFSNWSSSLIEKFVLVINQQIALKYEQQEGRVFDPTLLAQYKAGTTEILESLAKEQMVVQKDFDVDPSTLALNIQVSIKSNNLSGKFQTSLSQFAQHQTSVMAVLEDAQKLNMLLHFPLLDPLTGKTVKMDPFQLQLGLASIPGAKLLLPHVNKIADYFNFFLAPAGFDFAMNIDQFGIGTNASIGLGIRDGKNLESSLKTDFAAVPNFAFDTESYRGLNIHTYTPPDQSSVSSDKVVYFTISNQTLFLCVGPSGKKMLKGLLDYKDAQMGAPIAYLGLPSGMLAPVSEMMGVAAPQVNQRFKVTIKDDVSIALRLDLKFLLQLAKQMQQNNAAKSSPFDN